MVFVPWIRGEISTDSLFFKFSSTVFRGNFPFTYTDEESDNKPETNPGQDALNYLKSNSLLYDRHFIIYYPGELNMHSTLYSNT